MNFGINCIYDVCQKSFRIGVTTKIFQTQTKNFLLQIISLVFIGTFSSFSATLACTSRVIVLRSSVVTAFLRLLTTLWASASSWPGRVLEQPSYIQQSPPFCACSQRLGHPPVPGRGGCWSSLPLFSSHGLFAPSHNALGICQFLAGKAAGAAFLYTRPGPVLFFSLFPKLKSHQGDDIKNIVKTESCGGALKNSSRSACKRGTEGWKRALTSMGITLKIKYRV